MRQFLDDLVRRKKVHGFRLLKNRGAEGKTQLEKYHALIEFADDEQFGLPFAEINESGIHEGAHGAMIENLASFTVEVFSDA